MTTSNEIAPKPRSRERKRKKRAARGIGIQLRLCGYLSLFVVFILAVLWFFQVQMLHRFYENTKGKELERTAEAIRLSLGDDAAVESAVYQHAVQYSLCVQVFRVQGNRARIVATADTTSDCIIHHVPSDYLSTLYQYAVDNGGIYTGKVQFRAGGMVWIDSNGIVHHGGNFENEASEELWEEERPAADASLTEVQSDDISALYIQSFEADDGQEYVIMLDAVLTPMSATVSTLKTQFLWIAVVLLLGAVLLAYLMSRHISRPIVRMNEAAKQLARGQYDVPFEGSGYRETRELAQTLNVAAQELSKTDRLQKELIANVSHDLRTPLTMIAGYGEVMRDVPGENTPENVQVIIDETNRLSGLVDDMLDLSRLGAGMRRMHCERFDLTEAIRSVMARYEKLTEHEGYHISFDAAQSVSVVADRTMMLQVVYNLINNAINYAGEDRWVGVTLNVHLDRVRVSVCDRGAGIEEAQLPLIWDRYYKVDRVHRRATVGTGLGLSIVKGVLELHGAAYGVQSKLGEGSTFWFELPVASDAEGTIENDEGEKHDAIGENE